MPNLRLLRSKLPEPQAIEISTSQNWRPKNRSRQIGSKLVNPNLLSPDPPDSKMAKNVQFYEAEFSMACISGIFDRSNQKFGMYYVTSITTGSGRNSNFLKIGPALLGTPQVLSARLLLNAELNAEWHKKLNDPYSELIILSENSLAIINKVYPQVGKVGPVNHFRFLILHIEVEFSIFSKIQLGKALELEMEEHFGSSMLGPIMKKPVSNISLQYPPNTQT